MKDCKVCGKPTGRAPKAVMCLSCRKAEKNARVRAYREKFPEIMRETARRYKRRNPDKIKAAQKAWSERNRERVRIHSRRAMGIANPTGERPVGPCQICGTPADPLQCDHDHATGRIRGWLCVPCNRAIGFARDNPEILMRAAHYLAAAQLPQQQSTNPQPTEPMNNAA